MVMRWSRLHFTCGTSEQMQTGQMPAEGPWRDDTEGQALPESCGNLYSTGSHGFQSAEKIILSYSERRVLTSVVSHPACAG